MNRPTGLPHHTLAVLVENKAGVLARVADLFARRGYNIYSLAVAPTDDPRFSRITIVVDVESAPLEQIVKQLFKLINVVEIAEMWPDESVTRELIMVNVEVPEGRREELVALIERSHGRLLFDGGDHLTVSLAGDPSEVDAIEASLRPYRILDLQRTGRVALPKVGGFIPTLRAH